MVDSVHTTIECNSCLRHRPVTRFRKRFRGGTTRHRKCNDCHAAAERARRAGERLRQQNDSISTFARNVKNSETIDQVMQLCGTMIFSFGGVDSFSRKWARQLAVAQADRPGSKKTLDGFLAILKRVEAFEAIRPAQDFELLDDADLEREAMRQTEQLIMQNPAVAVSCARRLGWTVIPPAAKE